jgi:predicted alpha/beta superfamily hydrolase
MLRVKSIRTLAFVSVAIGNACGYSPKQAMPDPTAPDAGSAVPAGCAPGLQGAACVLDLYDQGCPAIDKLRTELDARAGLGPLWASGRALFRSDAPIGVAGDWNGWSPTALVTAPVCGTDLTIAVGAVPSGFHTYKLVDGDTWSLDPQDPAFAYDDFTGNPDHRNSVLDTPDSGRGHLVDFGQQCSSALGNCREITAYLPPGYGATDATYPVLFMHDGQNVWDDHTCCFGHTGWEINVTLDAEIAAGKVAPIIVIAAGNTTNRNNEYGLDATTMEAFMDFQVHELQPAALAKVRGDGKRVAIAGSSLGGLVSMELGLRYPDTYASIASLSGAFWPGLDTHTALLDQLPTMGKQPVSIYVDSGGDPTDDSDGAQDTIDVRDELVTLGWQRSDSPACTTDLCYYREPGATHDELAWKARAYRFLEYLFPAT